MKLEITLHAKARSDKPRGYLIFVRHEARVIFVQKSPNNSQTSIGWLGCSRQLRTPKSARQILREPTKVAVHAGHYGANFGDLRTTRLYDRRQKKITRNIVGASAYSASALFADVQKGVWNELYSGAPIDIWRGNLPLAAVR